MEIRPFVEIAKDWPELDYEMPAFFIGHGSPMNGIDDNQFSRSWRQMGIDVKLPKAVICISAHWLTNGTYVTAMPAPRTIHDFGGFPRDLYEVQYPAPGHPELAAFTSQLMSGHQVQQDHEWGFDHGAWTVLRHMFPGADVPILQLSIDYPRDAAYHYEVAQELKKLRKRGVLILGSGNMVHNLRMVDFSQLDTPGFGFPWAHEMNHIFKEKISGGDHKALIKYQQFGQAAALAIPTPDHYYPLIYTLGVVGENDKVEYFNDVAVAGSLTMTSVKFSE